MKVMVIGMARSGTSFLGQLFEQSPGFTYVFEPFWGSTPIRREQLVWRTEEDSWPEGATLVDDVLEGRIDRICALQPTPIQPRRFASREDELLAALGGTPGVPEGHDLAVKSIRLNLQMRWLRAHVGPDLKIIHLLRDPRGVAASFLYSQGGRRARLRSRLAAQLGRGGGRETMFHTWGWDEATDAARVSEPFAHLPELLAQGRPHERVAARWGLVAGQAMADGDHLDPAGYHRLRYEDLCRRPVETAAEIYGFLGRALPPELETWLRENTAGGDREDRFGTSRDSAAMAEVWRHQLSRRQVRDIDRVCGPQMATAGYAG